MTQNDKVQMVPEDRSHKIPAPPAIGGGLSRIATAFFGTNDGLKCKVDGVDIRVMTFKGSGVCSELYRKRRDGEMSEQDWLAAKAKGE